MFKVLTCLALGIACFAVVQRYIMWAAEKGINTAVTSYGKELSAKQNMDTLQTEFKCCGVHGYQDWFKVIWQNTAK